MSRRCCFAAAGIFLFIGCATWDYVKLSDIPVPAFAGSPADCGQCHEDQYADWKKRPHADSGDMNNIPAGGLRGCGACHAGLEGHAENPDSITPVKIEKLTKTEQNLLCGKCHYNRELMGAKAINPHDRHGLFMNVGLEGRKRQIACLDCHRGHGGKADMLRSIRAHACFQCHKEAIVTMGVFQPFNYLAAGKVCTGCHPAHGGGAPEQLARMTTGAVITCLVCHPTGNLDKLGF